MLQKISHTFNYLFDELYDSRTRDLEPNIGTLTTLLIIYIYFVKKAGPAWMKDRKPFDLTNIIFFYNIFQIIISSYIVYEGSVIAIRDFSLTCQPLIYGDTPLRNKFDLLTWLYSNLKLVELLDTVFFVLRKKYRQISSLHLYHHFMMPICGFIALKYYPNGHGTMLGLINSFVHVIMYSYYLIAGLGPQYQKYLWWKKYVTVLQLVQFAILFIHNLVPLVIGCEYPKWINTTLCLCSLHFVYMFGNFYYLTYIKQKNTPTKSKASEKIK